MSSKHDDHVIIIKTEIFDNFIDNNRIENVDLIKIDVEGAEYNILNGMRKTLERFHPLIFLEIHPTMISQFGHNVDEVIGILEEFNYSILPIDKKYLDFSSNITIICK